MVKPFFIMNTTLLARSFLQVGAWRGYGDSRGGWRVVPSEW